MTDAVYMLNGVSETIPSPVGETIEVRAQLPTAIVAWLDELARRRGVSRAVMLRILLYAVREEGVS